MKLTIVSVILILVLFTNRAAFALVYKCTDMNGKIHYIDKPCQSKNSELVELAPLKSTIYRQTKNAPIIKSREPINKKTEHLDVKPQSKDINKLQTTIEIKAPKTIRAKTSISDNYADASAFEFIMDTSFGKNNSVVVDGHKFFIQVKKSKLYYYSCPPGRIYPSCVAPGEVVFDIPFRIIHHPSTSFVQPILIDIKSLSVLQEGSTIECPYYTGRSAKYPPLTSKRLLFINNKVDGKFFCKLLIKPFQLSMEYRIYDNSFSQPLSKNIKVQFKPKNLDKKIVQHH